MDKQRIEAVAKDVLGLVYEQRKHFWPNGYSDAVVMLDPALGIHVMGFKFERHPELRLVRRRDDPAEVAGIIDRQAIKIAIAEKFGLQVGRFTAAHELGHLCLHPGMVMHRDPPICDLSERASRGPLPLAEREANYFAANFLVTEKLLRREFSKRFGRDLLEFDDTTAFKLCMQDPDSVLEQSGEGRARIVATARSFGPPPFVPLNEHFGVSPSVMTYRLLELGIVSRR